MKKSEVVEELFSLEKVMDGYTKLSEEERLKYFEGTS